MRFKITREQLEGAAAKLMLSYTGTNPQRLSFIVLLKKLTELYKEHPNIEVILFGAIIYEIELIRSEYQYLFFPEQSQLFRSLHETIGVTKENRLVEDERLVYLNKLYWFICDEIYDDFILKMKLDEFRIQKNFPLIWNDHSGLLDNIYSVLLKFKKHDAARIGFLSYAAPELPKLSSFVNECMNKPVETSIIPDVIRVSLFYDDRSDLMNYYKLINAAYVEPTSADGQANLASVYKGLIVFTLLRIKSRYHHLDPKRSKMYRDCLDIFQIEDFDGLDCQHKLSWLTALYHYVEAMPLQINSEIIIAFKTHIMTYMTEQVKASAASVTKDKYIVPTVLGTIKSNLRMAIDKISYSAVDLSFTTVAFSLLGPAGLISYVSLRFTVSGLSYLVNENVLTNTNEVVSSLAFSYFSANDKDIFTEQMLRYPPTFAGMTSMLQGLSTDEQNAFWCWVDALLNLPAGILKPEEQANIKDVLHLEQPKETKRMTMPC